MRFAIESLLAFVPWILSMYLLYWLEVTGIWTTETQHRDKISVLILAFGMALSFFVHSLFAKRTRETGRQGADP